MSHAMSRWRLQGGFLVDGIVIPSVRRCFELRIPPSEPVCRSGSGQEWGGQHDVGLAAHSFPMFTLNRNGSSHSPESAATSEHHYVLDFESPMGAGALRGAEGQFGLIHTRTLSLLSNCLVQLRW